VGHEVYVEVVPDAFGNQSLNLVLDPVGEPAILDESEPGKHSSAVCIDRKNLAA
jgi:hypothetical protein